MILLKNLWNLYSIHTPIYRVSTREVSQSKWNPSLTVSESNMNNEVNLKLLIVYIQNCLLKFESEVFQLNDMNTVKLGLQIVPLLVSPFFL